MESRNMPDEIHCVTRLRIKYISRFCKLLNTLWKYAIIIASGFATVSYAPGNRTSQAVFAYQIKRSRQAATFSAYGDGSRRNKNIIRLFINREYLLFSVKSEKNNRYTFKATILVQMRWGRGWVIGCFCSFKARIHRGLYLLPNSPLRTLRQ